MVFNVQNILPIIVIYLSYTHGFGLWEKGFKPPENLSETRTCRGWLGYHRILGVDITKDVEAAHNRDKSKDSEVHVLAAGYAYLLTSFPINNLIKNGISPKTFCERLGYIETLLTYSALKDTELSCSDWIHRYGYTKDNYETNGIMAHKRGIENIGDNDGDPHLMVTLYASFLTHDGTDSKIPEDFCELMGWSNVPLFSFITLNTKKTCQDWIYFSGYTTNVDSNISKAVTQNVSYKVYHNRYTQEYINHLLFPDEYNQIKTGCCFISTVHEPRRPWNFCMLKGFETENTERDYCYYNGFNSLFPF